MANTDGSVTNFRTIVHPSLPNYVAATSGGTQGITDDAAPSSHPLRVQSIFGWGCRRQELEAYQEGMTSNWTSNTGRYAVKAQPGAYYVPLRSSCQINDVPMGTTTSGNFVNDINSGTLPNCSFVTHDMCNSTHDCSVGTVMPFSRPGLARSWPGPTTNAATP